MTSMQMKDGFYPALGTPTNDHGVLNKSSYNKGIKLMIEAGAQGVLCMGSMGKMTTIRNSEYANIAKSCSDIVSNRIPLLVGVMDCSASKVLDRIDALGNINIQGVVATTPFFSKISKDEIINFFKILSKNSRYPVYLYDLPSVTQSPITGEVLKSLLAMPNIKGIKTANLNLIMEAKRNNWVKDDFSIFYSGLDLFDVASNFGVGKNLDGMFTCTPHNTKLMYDNIRQGNFIEVSKHLNNIIKLRNLFLKENVLPVYSYAMELIGCPGNYHIDYDNPLSNKLKEEVYNCMKAIKEI